MFVSRYNVAKATMKLPTAHAVLHSPKNNLDKHTVTTSNTPVKAKKPRRNVRESSNNSAVNSSSPRRGQCHWSSFDKTFLRGFVSISYDRGGATLRMAVYQIPIFEKVVSCCKFRISEGQT